MLTPQDIENKMFKVSFKGYSTEEVDDFLQEICDSYVLIHRENKKYEEQIVRLSEAVEKYKAMEGTLQNALSVADKSSDEIEKDAYAKANEIIRNAERTAEAMIEGAKQEVLQEKKRLEDVQREAATYRDKIKDLLNAQMNILNGYSAMGLFTKTETAPKPDNKRSADVWGGETKAYDKRKVQAEDTTARIDMPADDMKTEDLPKLRQNEKGEYVKA